MEAIRGAAHAVAGALCDAEGKRMECAIRARVGVSSLPVIVTSRGGARIWMREGGERCWPYVGGCITRERGAAGRKRDWMRLAGVFREGFKESA